MIGLKLMNFVLEKVERYIADNHMLHHGAHVVVGVSGGADSMCLLFVLMLLKEKLDLKLTVVHINHGIRGEDGDKDQQFVEDFCKKHGLMWKSFRCDIPKLAKEEHLSEEEAGRKFRYDCFASTAGDDGLIAVAHHKNDVAETMLLNLFRGTGLRGLCGIPAVRDRVIRPILCLDREEIEDFLADNHLDFCTDKTNLENVYARNKIRNVLLPFATEQINEGAQEHLLQLAALTKDVVDYIQKQQEQVWTKVCREDGSLDVKVLGQQDKVIVGEIIRRKIGEMAGGLKDIGQVHVDLAVGLLDNQVGKQVTLPYNIKVVRGYDCLKFVCDEAPIEENEAPELEFRTFNWEELERIEQKLYTKWIDYDKIKGSLVLRHRRSGDYMVVDSKGSKKKLRRIMIDDKIPQERRDEVWCVADEDHIVWMIGGRISETYKITSQTKKVLEIKVKGENEHGR